MPSKPKPKPASLGSELNRRCNVSFSPDGEPRTPPSPIDRTPSGMILTSSRSMALPRQRSMSASGPLFTQASSINNWADEMDKQDARIGLLPTPPPFSCTAAQQQPPQPPPVAPGVLKPGQLPASVERLQSGLAPVPRLPPNYVPSAEVHSSFGVQSPETIPIHGDAATLPPGARVVVSHDPYTINGKMNWSLVDSRTQTFMDEFETQLKDITVEYLMDPDINRFQGSVPVEKIQNILRCQHRDLYDKVVGSKHRSWNKFVEKHQDSFELFSIEDGKWRMRLASHTNYRLGDKREKEAREAEDAHFMKALMQYLMSLPDRACKVDDFIAAYSDLPCNRVLPNGALEHPLPKRGDFVRFVKRHGKRFAYDPNAYVIRLMPAGRGHGQS